MKQLEVKTVEHDYPSRLKLTTIKYANVTVFVSTVDLTIRRKESESLRLLDKILGYTHRYETGIWYETTSTRSKVVIVETYNTSDEALSGHKKWVDKVLHGTKEFKVITELFSIKLL